MAQLKHRCLLPRVCFVTETYYPVTGGGETQTRILAEFLAARRFELFIITRRSYEALKTVDSVDGVSVHRISPVGGGQFTRWRMAFCAFFALARMHRQYDVIFVSGFKALGLAAVLVAKLFHKSCVLKADSNGEMSGEFFAAGLKRLGLTASSITVRALLLARNKILQGADSFVAITADIAKELQTHGVDPRLIVSIANSVDVLRYRPAEPIEKQQLRQRLVLPKKEIIVTYSGRLVSYKGLPLLLRVAEKIQREVQEVGFVLVGSGGADMHNCEAELKQFVKAKSLETVICFPGEVSNVHEYLQASDIFVLPSEQDAFPLALIEAMACGLPVVSTSVGGIKEIIVDRQNGLLVEAGDFRQLYEGICVLIRDAALSGLLGAAARQTVRERYAADNIADKYCELFQRVNSRCFVGSA